MKEQNLIPIELKSFEYYKNKLPLYLKNSYQFQTHFKLWWEFLIGEHNKGIVGAAETLLNLMNIFDEDYLEYAEQYVEDYSTNKLDFLDKIAALFGVNRSILVTYTYSGTTTTETLNLTNEEFLILIRAQIIKNYCEGTREQLEEYYKSIGLDVYIITSSANPAEADFYLIPKDDTLDNIDKLFLAGFLEINSMGILYNRQIFSLPDVLLWDIGFWDRGEWAV